MKIKTCIEDIEIKKEDNTTIIFRADGFQAMGNSTIGSGIDNIKSIVHHGLKNRDHPLPYKEGEICLDELEKEKQTYLKAIIEYKEIKEPVVAILTPAEDVKFEDVTNEGVTALATAYNNKKLSLSIIVLIDQDLDQKTLLKLFKSTIDAKNAALWDMGVINHFSFDPLDIGDEESILIASKGYGDSIPSDKLLSLIKNVQITVRESVKKALCNCGFPKDVLNYMDDVGVGVEELVDAGMEMIVGVEQTQEIRNKLEKQIYHSLEDLNVVSFIIAGIRLEEDYEKHRIHGVDVDDDPAYLYSDEVFGMSIANQIAGTKAIFNFKRYDEAKPGIISKLGPVLDDVFAGLIAGCMSKIFEV